MTKSISTLNPMKEKGQNKHPIINVLIIVMAAMHERNEGQRKNTKCCMRLRQYLSSRQFVPMHVQCKIVKGSNKAIYIVTKPVYQPFTLTSCSDHPAPWEELVLYK